MREWEKAGRGVGEQGRRGAEGEELGSSAAVSLEPFDASLDSQSLENCTPAPLHPRTPLPTPHSPPLRAKAKHIPERTCAACRTKMAQSDLYRIRKTPEGWTMDRGVKVGRSAYLCSSPYCHVEKRLKRTFGAQAAQIAGQIAAHQATLLPEKLKVLEDQKEK